MKRGLVVFVRSREAVLGLPMRLVVSMILGMVALGSILGMMSSMCVVSEPVVVSVSPLLVSLGGNDSGVVSVTVKVSDREGRCLADASVMVLGLGGAGVNVTNRSGCAVVSLGVSLEDGVGEGWVDVVVDASSHVRFRQEAMVEVVRGT